ncbi:MULTISPECIES: tail tape measure protein [unclassified Novosphingobium]|uniref:tail tape measure protein n=1 Tax=unclassified Novosphingobium TaxID=2644732 RepID=UPI000EEEDDF4|nr:MULTISPECIES: tail tape measure protein [unclassified Novosphingobium]HCF24633.1 tail tape measure protein [Novosphingobium sp.]HQV04235.1 tail tape measure protein [Novosphingobium sp.]
MTDAVESLLIDVRANTQGFAADVAAMRSTFDSGLLDGFERAGSVLERGLLSAIRKGSLGFEDLRRIALNVMDQIAGQALNSMFASMGMSSGSGGGGGTLGALVSFGTTMLTQLLGLPGRATGGPVSPGRGYVVGERGPELFVPTSAGRIEPGPGRAGREVKVNITIAAPPGTGAPQALQRSGRQVASAVRRALSEF